MASVLAASPSPIVKLSTSWPSARRLSSATRGVHVGDRRLAHDGHPAVRAERVPDVGEGTRTDEDLVGLADGDRHATHWVNSSTTASATASGARPSVLTCVVGDGPVGGVAGLGQAHERRERRVGEERPVDAVVADPLGEHRGVGPQPHDEPPRPQRRPVLGVEDRAATTGDHERRR